MGAVANALLFSKSRRLAFRVYLVPANRVPLFRPVNANLVRAGRLETALTPRVSRQPLFDFNVRDGFFSSVRQLRAAAPPIAAIGYEI